jgi:NAD-dependent DNA ligase
MIHKTEPKMPTQYNYSWTSGNVDIKLSSEDAENNSVVKTKIIEEFFKKLEVVGLGYKNVVKLYEAGYNTIEKMVKMKIKDIEQLPGMGKKSAEKIINSIEDRLTNVELYVMMSASHCFGRGIGERKMKELLTHYPFVLSSKSKDSIKVEKISALKGFNTKTANQIVPYINNFKKFANQLGVLYKIYDFKLYKKKQHPLHSKKLVVTGTRDKEFMLKIKKLGISLSSSVSKNTDYVIVKSLNEQTSKTNEAKKLNVSIITVSEFTKKYL